MRLYDRILGSGFASVNAADPPIHIQDMMQSAVRIDITNIAEYLAAFPEDKTWNLRDAVSLMMPFQLMWLEWQSGIARAGLLAMQSAQNSLSQDDKEQRFELFLDERGLHDLSGGRPIHIGSIVFAIDGRDGSYVPDSLGYIIPRKIGNNPKWQRMLSGKVPAINMTLSLMHCKNVEIVDANPAGTRQQRRFEERRGIQVAQFKTLVVDPDRTQKRCAEDDGRQSQSRDMAAHIVRGHFATYTEDRPRFGRAKDGVGTFWISPHVRGSTEVGMVGKDYSVKAPK